MAITSAEVIVRHTSVLASVSEMRRVVMVSSTNACERLRDPGGSAPSGAPGSLGAS
jgi:hypothetical protein